MANLLDRIKYAIFDRKENEDDDAPDEDITLEDISQTKGIKSKYQVFKTGYKGFLSEDPNPILNGRSAIEEFDKMRTVDAQVNATLLAVELPIRSTEWTVNPGKTKKQDLTMETTPKDQEIADFVKYNLFTNCRTSWDDYIRQSLGMLWAGFAISEKVYEEKNGKIMLKKLSDRPQRTIQEFFDADGRLAIKQDGGVVIPWWKVIVHTYRKEGDNFAGRSAIRPAYQNWKYKTQLYRLDAIAHERNSLKIPVITTPDNPTDPEKTAAREIAKNMKSSEHAHAVLPGKDWTFKLEGSGSDNQGMMKSIGHHNREISKAILAQFLELGADGNGGSYALSEDQSDLFILGLQGIAKNICRVTNEFLIKELVDMNFDIQEGQTYPELDFDKIGSVDYKTIVEALTGLAEKKLITPDNSIEDKLRDMFDMPKAIYTDEGKIENGREVTSPKIDISSLAGGGKKEDPQNDPGVKDKKKKFSEIGYSGCVMASVDTSEVPTLSLAEEDIVTREEYKHVTLIYGLRDDVTMDEITKRVEFGFVNQEKIEILSMDIFENDETDVLVFKVKPTRFLEFTRDALKMLPNEQTYPTWIPHITLAYMKKGTATKYLSKEFDGKEISLTEVTCTASEDANPRKLFSEEDMEAKFFSELRHHFDFMDLSKLSSLIK